MKMKSLEHYVYSSSFTVLNAIFISHKSESMDIYASFKLIVLGKVHTGSNLDAPKGHLVI